MEKISDKISKEAYKFYLRGHSITETAKVVYLKHKTTISPEGLRKKFIKLGIKLRNRQETINLFLRKIFSDKQIKNIIKLYTKKKFPIRKIARLTKINRIQISRILKENNIKILDKEKAMLLANTKHKKTKFSGNEEEKAYLIGFALGDLHIIKKSKYTLRVTSATTHKAFMDLIKCIFNKYGPIYFYPIKQKENYRYNISIGIDLESFNFLLDLDRLKYFYNKSSFLYFLAGIIDSDGSIIIRKTGKYLQYVIRVFSQNLCLLNKIKNELIRNKFNPTISLNAKKGKVSKSLNTAYNKDYYMLEIYQKKDVMKLLKVLPIKHEEKMSWKEMIVNLENKNIIYHKDAQDYLIDLRKKIDNEFKQCVNEAKIKYNLKDYPLMQPRGLTLTTKLPIPISCETLTTSSTSL